MVERLFTNGNFFDVMRSKVTHESAVVIQRNWRETIVKLRKLRAAQKALTKRKLHKILHRWLRVCKVEKNKSKKSLHTGLNSLALPKEDHSRKSAAVDLGNLRGMKKKRPSNVSRSAVGNIFQTSSTNIRLQVNRRKF